MDFAFTFMELFLYGVWLAMPIFVLLLVVIIICGQLVGKLESWNRFDAFYWSFITASTVGYGDFRPVKVLSKFVSIFIAFCGLILTGIYVAIAINAATEGLKRYVDVEEVRTEWEQID